MNSPPRLIAILTMLALSGCGEFAYKTGAGADALAADKAACQQAGGDHQTCLHDKGWMISNLSGDDVLPAPTATASPAVGQPASPEAMPAAVLATPGVTAPAPVQSAATPADPMTSVKMTTWIKFGAGSPNDDIASCVATLGPGNAPDTVGKTVTRGLLACMRQKGWRGL